MCPRSATRNEKRVDAMRECVKMIATSAGGCCTSFPFEAAIWLLEEQEELCGGTVPIFGEVSHFLLNLESSLNLSLNFVCLPPYNGCGCRVASLLLHRSLPLLAASLYEAARGA